MSTAARIIDSTPEFYIKTCLSDSHQVPRNFTNETPCNHQWRSILLWIWGEMGCCLMDLVGRDGF